MKPVKISDLTSNWNGSIAIKVTAITIWIILILAFATTIPFVSSFESYSERNYSWKNLQLIKQLEKLDEYANTPLIIQNTVQQFIHDNGIHYAHITINGKAYEIGSAAKDNYILTTKFDGKSIQDLHLEFPSLSRSATLLRVKIGSSIVGFSVLFSLFLFWLNKQIIHQPFNEIITLIQRISSGSHELRFDNQRKDEFGLVARFLNEMLDTLQQNQLQLSHANSELTEEIKHREEALAASRQKSTFLANMSHEIRTPLSSIMGYTERLRYSNIKSEPEKQQMLDIVLQNGNHLMHLINDILDLSKIEANKLVIHRQDISIIKILEHTRRLLSERAIEKGIQLNINYQLPVPELIHNDPTRIKQIILNLASNAIRFTDEGKVDINVYYDNKDELKVEVTDTGIGMTQKQQNNLFQPFSQADDSIEERYGGTGLGLTISRRLAELMDGNIEVESISGIGSRFTFRFRTGIDPDKITLIESLNPQDFDIRDYDKPVDNLRLNGKILLVEDTPEIQQLVKAYLEDYGIEIETADNGTSGVEKALRNDYDLVLMDIQMPVMNGIEAMKELKLSSYAKPVIALTADAIPEHEDQFRQVGFAHTLTKPIIINKLIYTIQKYLPHEPSKAITQKDTTERHRQPATVTDSNADKTDILRDLKEKYLIQLPIYLNELRQSMESGNYMQAHAVLHQLKGISGSLGYQDLTDIASETSELLRHGEKEKAEKKIDLIESYFIH